MAGDGMVTPGNFASQFLMAIGKPTTAAWQAVINAWVHAEGGYAAAGSIGAANNNPLNAHWYPGDSNAIGSVMAGSERLAVYPSLDAAIASYTGGVFLRNGLYKGILAAKTPQALADAIVHSPWAAGPGHGKLPYGGSLGTFPSDGTNAGTPTGAAATGTGSAVGKNTSGSAAGTPNATQTGLPVPVPFGNPISDFLTQQLLNLFGIGQNAEGSTIDNSAGGNWFISLILLLLGVGLVFIGIARITKSGGTIINLVGGGAAGMVAKKQVGDAVAAGGAATTRPTPDRVNTSDKSPETPRTEGAENVIDFDDIREQERARNARKVG